MWSGFYDFLIRSNEKIGMQLKNVTLCVKKVLTKPLNQSEIFIKTAFVRFSHCSSCG